MKFENSESGMGFLLMGWKAQCVSAFSKILFILSGCALRVGKNENSKVKIIARLIEYDRVKFKILLRIKGPIS